jgi:molybdate transport system substrate-binding protein
LNLKRLLIIFVALISVANVCAQNGLKLAAAADLEPVLPPILEQFRQSTGIRVDATYQASAMLTTQIMNGAPFHAFLSADLSYPQRLIDAGLADGGANHAPVTYARGTLVLWARSNSQLPPPSMELLRNPGLKRLAIANPDRAPYGRAAIASLKALNMFEALKPRLVTAENIAQAAQFADSGNADAGLISLTSAMTQKMRSDGTYFRMDPSLYPPIEQGAVVISKSPRRDDAQKLIDYLMSAPVQAQFAKSGLTPVR